MVSALPMVEVLPAGINICFSFDPQFIHIHFTRHPIMNFKDTTIVATLTAISLIALTAPAKATAYRNTNIYLELKEGGINVNDGPTGRLGTATYKS